MKSFTKTLKCIIILNILTFTPISTARRSFRHLNVITCDNLLIARCKSSCSTCQDDNNCEDECLRNFLENSVYKKYGDCPSRPRNTLDSICVNACNDIDYKCGGIQKCCPHSCGKSCQDPLGLSMNDQLPSVPVNFKISEKRRNSRAVEIQWDSLKPFPVSVSPIFYVVESRSHIGINFANYKLGDWELHIPSNYYEEKINDYTRYVGDFKVKPGRWYQFRVSAVNEYGTRGYSNITKEFQLSFKPRSPKAPKNLILQPLVQQEDGTYSRNISWTNPRSDLPIEKYKISWSLYINEKDQNKNANESLLKESVTVSEPIRHYEIKGLHPNAIYYVQIQAISMYGKRRLRSETESCVMNTTLTENKIENKVILTKRQSFDNLSMVENQKSIKSGFDARLQIKFSVKNAGFVTTLTWNEKNNQKYVIILCKGGKNCLDKRSLSTGYQEIATRKTFHEFHNLNFGSQYTIGFKYSHKKTSNYDVVRSFYVPTCESYKKKNNLKVDELRCPKFKRHKAKK